MTASTPRSTVRRGDTAPRPGDQGPLGPALRRAWVGYQRRLDQEMAAAGFADRAFPDGRVLRMCSGPEETTVSEIGRELGITRQGASKIVGGLREGRYVTVGPSATDGRERIVTLTAAGHRLSRHPTQGRTRHRASAGHGTRTGCSGQPLPARRCPRR